MTYALDKSHKTHGARELRDVRVADERDRCRVRYRSIGYRGVYLYNVTDTNGNKIADPAEIQAALAPGLRHWWPRATPTSRASI